MADSGASRFPRRPAKESPFAAANYVSDCIFTVGPEVGGNAINVAVQLVDANFNPIPGTSQEIGPGQVTCYLSDNPDGSTVTGTTPTSVLIGTNGLILASVVTLKLFEILSNALGQFDLNVTKAAAHDYYLVVCMPDGSIRVSPIVHLT